jgi:CubicO group peptidase (beta-lactamase class C family)
MTTATGRISRGGFGPRREKTGGADILEVRLSFSAVAKPARRLALAFALAAGTTGASQPATASADPGDPPAATIETIQRDAMQRYHLKSIIVRVTSDGRDVYTKALGESMSGVPATPAMHFRNGALAFTYMSTLLLEFVDLKRVRLDDKLSAFFPELPSADKISLRNLANMTSGYADYVYQPEVLKLNDDEPFRRWTSDELIHAGVSKPMQFEPGTNWGYSHTNYAILGRVLEKIAGMPLSAALEHFVFGPMGLKETGGSDTPQVPEPVLHSFSSERRVGLGIPADKPFYEESTFWNPSWTTAPGAVETTDIADLTTTMQAVGDGVLVSTSSRAAQIAPHLIGFGRPAETCSACRKMTSDFSYGLGVMLIGPWIAQSKFFAGSAATVGYLPAKRLAIAVVVTYLQTAYDDKGNAPTGSDAIFGVLATKLAPGTFKKP